MIAGMAHITLYKKASLLSRKRLFNTSIKSIADAETSLSASAIFIYDHN